MGETLSGKHCLSCENFICFDNIIDFNVDVSKIRGICNSGRGKDGYIKGNDVCELWEKRKGEI